MTGLKIRYRAGYKYQLAETFRVRVRIRPPATIETEFITLTKRGLLFVKHGYAWDGPSGPAVDTPDFMRASLAHDALYQLLRQGYLDGSCRILADRELRRICRQDGMSWFRASYVYLGVRLGARYAADPADKKKVAEAP